MMTIQINTDKTLNGDEKMKNYFSSQVKDALKRYESHITRVEIHLKYENSTKDGLNDISCLLEARLEGRQPIVATNQADITALAFSGALAKIETAIETILGRIKNR
jgi:ribosome-associated translation inhibitor RaiA